ncbi:MAG: TraG/TraD/VirD4 family protein, partial [Actinobacteria bacterium]|nr:TraG/TraD/VirD4 family protein [Actinomycetota bacterium]
VADLLDHLRSSGSSADGDFWQAIAGRFLAPLIQAAALSGGSIEDVVSWIDGFEVDLVASILVSHQAFEAESAWLACCSRDERLIGSALATALTVIEPITELGGGLPLQPAQLLDQSGTAYLCAPMDDQRRYAGLFVSIIRDVLGEVGRRATLEARAIYPPLLLVLDEATSIAPLAELDSLAATVVGQGVTLVTVVQDLAQLRARYGQKANTIVSNHAVRIFLPGIADLPTLELLSALGGERSRGLVRSRDSQPYGLGSPASPPERRPLITSHELRTMPRGEAMVLAGSLPIFRLHLGAKTRAAGNLYQGRKELWGSGHYASRVWKSSRKSQCSHGQRRGPLLSRWTRSKSSQV